MNYEIIPTRTFKREFKQLSKKYLSLKDDLDAFEKELKENPEMGDNLGNNTRKIRMAITSKNRGKSGGARIITYHLLIDIENSEIYLLSIYDKNEQESLSGNEIRQLKKKNGLLEN
jgi:mRNA-degrading endonuclease RelE of RelBE toxin-antitoxin system